ncbi:MAG: hypothetical protein GPJ54_08515 [Candidatus Heimdallarchaeota archaeon]|nr:hypothetical protein [Candidatus Heimdallarchaeota archaeon]
MDDTLRTTRIYNIEGIIQLFVSIGAIPAGIMMIITPDGSSLGMEEIVDVIPFDNLIIPGILLILFNGIGQGVAGRLSLQKHEYASYAGFIFGVVLVIWIFVQVIMVEDIHFAHIFYFIIGFVEVVLSVLMYQRRNIIE